MPAAVVDARVDELLSVLDLDHARRTLIGDYSTGMRKKIGLATALLHGPELLVLDEPFEGVDPVSAAVVRAILDGFIAAGGTVVLSSHVMALVEQLCDHVAVLDHGRLLRVGTRTQVRAGHCLEEAFARRRAHRGGHQCVVDGCGRPARTRIAPGRDIGTVVTAVAISLLAMA